MFKKEIFGQLCLVCKGRLIYGGLDNKITFNCANGCFKGEFTINLNAVINNRLKTK